MTKILPLSGKYPRKHMYARVGLRRGELTLPLVARRLGAEPQSIWCAWRDGRIAPFAVRAEQRRKSGAPNPIFREDQLGEISFAIDRLAVDLPGRRRLNAVADRGRSPEDTTIARDTLAKLLKAALLTDEERKVVILCYGLDGRAPQTQVEIAEGWVGETTGKKVSPAWIGRLHANALTKLINARWEIDPAGELVSLIEQARLHREIVARRSDPSIPRSPI